MDADGTTEWCTGAVGGSGGVGAADTPCRAPLPDVLIPGVGSLLSVLVLLRGARRAYCTATQQICYLQQQLTFQLNFRK
jgi:hypothetical protein